MFGGTKKAHYRLRDIQDHTNKLGRMYDTIFNNIDEIKEFIG